MLKSLSLQNAIICTTASDNVDSDANVDGSIECNCNISSVYCFAAPALAAAAVAAADTEKEPKGTSMQNRGGILAQWVLDYAHTFYLYLYFKYVLINFKFILFSYILNV